MFIFGMYDGEQPMEPVLYMGENEQAAIAKWKAEMKPRLEEEPTLVTTLATVETAQDAISWLENNWGAQIGFVPVLL